MDNSKRNETKRMRFLKQENFYIDFMFKQIYKKQEKMEHLKREHKHAMKHI